MINKKEIEKTLDSYKTVRIGTLGGHSALDVCRGAKDLGFETVVVCQKGREKTYDKYYKSRDGKGIVDHIIIVDKFSDITKKEVQEKLIDLNTVFVHSRYFWVYCNYKEIEEKFKVPIFGTRLLVRKEERDEDKNQYYILEKAGINTPKFFKSPKDIDRLVIVKVPEAQRSYERAFFLANNYDSYVEESEKMIKEGRIKKENLKSAVIEEFIIGPQINLNFFYSPITDELELLGTDTRRQTNIDGLLRLTAKEQLEVLKFVSPKYIEQGHIAVTMKESLVEKAFDIGEKFVKATKKIHPPGIIGPFALQGAVAAYEGKEEFVIFDVSMRIPGSPGTKYTPYGHYLYGEDISVGKRIAMEIKKAQEKGVLKDLVT